MKYKDLNYWKKNAEEDYMKTPISVLRYIAELEEVAEQKYAVVDKDYPTIRKKEVAVRQGLEIFYEGTKEYCIEQASAMKDILIEKGRLRKS